MFQVLLLEAHLGPPLVLIGIVLALWVGLVAGSIYLVRRAWNALRSPAEHEQAVGVMWLVLVAIGLFLFSKLWASF